MSMAIIVAVSKTMIATTTVASYRRSLELNAENGNAETRIQQLQERVTAGR